MCSIKLRDYLSSVELDHQDRDARREFSEAQAQGWDYLLGSTAVHGERAEVREAASDGALSGR